MTEDRTVTDIEREYQEAEKALLKMIGETTAVQHVRTLTRCIDELSVEVRNAGSRIAHLERELHSADRSAEKGLAQMRQAAAARSAIAAEAVKELRKLVAPAIAQAKKGKPGLLRMILRATR